MEGREQDKRKVSKDGSRVSFRYFYKTNVFVLVSFLKIYLLLFLSYIILKYVKDFVANICAVASFSEAALSQLLRTHASPGRLQWIGFLGTSHG